MEFPFLLNRVIVNSITIFVFKNNNQIYHLIEFKLGKNIICLTVLCKIHTIERKTKKNITMYKHIYSKKVIKYFSLGIKIISSLTHKNGKINIENNSPVSSIF